MKLISWGIHLEREKEIICTLFTSSIKLAVRHFHVDSRAWTVKKCTKKAWCSRKVVVLRIKPIAFLTSLYVFALISTAGYRTAGALHYLVVTPCVIIGCGLWTSGWHLMRLSHGTNKLGSCPPSLALILIKLFVLPRAYSKDLLKNMRLLQISWASGNVPSWSVMRRFRHSSPPPTCPSPSPKDPERFSSGWQFNAFLRRLKTYLKGTQSENEETSVSLLNALLSFPDGKRYSQERPGADNLERPVDFTSTEWMLLSIAMTFARNWWEIFEHQSQPREDKAVPTFYFPVFHSAARDTF